MVTSGSESISDHGSATLTIVAFDESVATLHPMGGNIDFTPHGGGRETSSVIPVELTAFGDVGEMVEGTAGPVDVKGTKIAMRFRVCRTADWHVRL